MSLKELITNSSSLDSLPGGQMGTSPWFNLKYAISFGIVLSSLIWAAWTRLLGQPRNKLIPGIYIVGGSKKHEIKATSSRFWNESDALLLDGYRHTQGGKEPYYVPSEQGARLILPARYMEELKSAPMDKVDFLGIIHDMFEYEYTGIAHRSRIVPSTLTTQLTPRLPSIMPGIQDEIKVAMADEFPPCDDWTEVDLMRGISRVVTRATSHMLGGKTMSQDEDWNKAAINYTLLAVSAAQKIKRTPWLVRRLVAPLLTEVRKTIPWCYSQATRVGVPMLQHRERTGEQANDFLQFLIDSARGEEKDNTFVSHRLLQVAFASLHTSMAIMGGIFYDLCQHPELVEILRDEYQGIVDRDGNIPKEGFAKLIKMDSVMKESQRLNPITLLTFERIITEERTLKDGLTIPAGTFIGVPSYHIAMDPEIYPEPEKFDGLRFERLRDDPVWGNKAQFASASPNSLAFGYGRHACPGRQFVEQEFKSFLVKFLSHYDFKFVDGQTKRVPNVPFETQYLLHPVPILIKRRRL